MLVFCGCVGQSGGGWSHYVGQEKLRPQTGWLPLAFALDWSRPPRQMNSTSYFYNHASQWRYRKTDRAGAAVAAGRRQQIQRPASSTSTSVPERMGWLPSAPQLNVNPLTIKQQADGRRALPRGVHRPVVEIGRYSLCRRAAG